MKIQESILRQYMRRTGNVTLKSISNDTGLQVTRIFRLLNGAEMKLNEYRVFYWKVQDLHDSKICLQNLAEECALKLPSGPIKEIENIILKKLKLWNLTYGHDKKSKWPFQSISI